MNTFYKHLSGIAFRLFLCGFAIANHRAAAQTGVYVPSLALFDSKMQGLISKYNLAGGQMAITYQGRLVYSRGFGYADTSDKSLVQPQSIFRLASVSKSITALTIMKLIEQGRIRLDDKVIGTSGILKDTQYANAIDPRMYQFTVRHLLNHSAGFNYDFASEPLWQSYNIAIAMGVPPPANSFELVLKWTLLNKSLGFAPGTSASYTNFGYTLLGLVIKKITGMEYETYVRDSVLRPLGITDMHAGKSLKQNKFANEVSYYDYAGAPLSTSVFTGVPNSVPAQYGGYHWEIMTSAGGWVASARDLCRIMVAMDKLGSPPDMLNAKTIDTMLLKSVQWPTYALGWFVTPDEYYHTGGIQGTATVIRCYKPKQLNYAILFNALPQNYTPLYNEFISLVTNEFNNITSWPSHDLFAQGNGMDEAMATNGLQLFPNPASNQISISHGQASQWSMVSVINIEGREVLRHNSVDAPYVLDISLLEPGIYFLKLMDEEGNSQVNKFVKK